MSCKYYYCVSTLITDITHFKYLKWSQQNWSQDLPLRNRIIHFSLADSVEHWQFFPVLPFSSLPQLHWLLFCLHLCDYFACSTMWNALWKSSLDQPYPNLSRSRNRLFQGIASVTHNATLFLHCTLEEMKSLNFSQENWKLCLSSRVSYPASVIAVL